MCSMRWDLQKELRNMKKSGRQKGRSELGSYGSSVVNSIIC